MSVIIKNSNSVVERVPDGSLSIQKPNSVSPIEIRKRFKSVVPSLFFMTSVFLPNEDIFKILLLPHRSCAQR